MHNDLPILRHAQNSPDSHSAKQVIGNESVSENAQESNATYLNNNVLKNFPPALI